MSEKPGASTDKPQPDPHQVQAYRKAYAIYQELYPALRASFKNLSALGE